MDVITELGLTEKQTAFLDHVVSGVEPTKAAELAGYANGSSAASQLLRLPTVLAAIQMEVGRRIGAMAPLALKVMLDIARDESAPKGVRVEAAKAILDRAGHGPRKPEPVSLKKDVHDLSPDELRAFVAEATLALAERKEAGTLQ